MASTKSQGSSSNGRDSAGQRLGIKAYGGEVVTAGSIIVRQRGTKFFAGLNVKMGSDNTLFARIPGTVKFEWQSKDRQRISVYPVNAKPA
ncbi:MAG: 50S ribosomal protein L27 [Elusimicrobiota bacterium]|jgi:large subunit ribosomal protein L27